MMQTNDCGVAPLTIFPETTSGIAWDWNYSPPPYPYPAHVYTPVYTYPQASPESETIKALRDAVAALTKAVEALSKGKG